MSQSTLAQIRIKVRRLTDSPAEAQITTAQIDEYINTFYQLDFPAHLRLLTNLVPFTFYTLPNVDVYATNADAISSVNTLSDFKNRVISVHPPIYIEGDKAFFTQSPGEFFGIYPKNKQMGDTGLAHDGVITNFSGTLDSIPVQRHSVSFTSETVLGNQLNLVDTELAGVLTGTGTGTINYVTGAYQLQFSSAPSALSPIYSHTLPYKAARPRAIMYYSNTFTLRPIPDNIYSVEMQVYQSLTDLLTAGATPELNQWWQYIAYGGAKKIFEDRMDLDSVALIMPEFKQQERLVLRRSLVQQSNERTATIYTENSEFDVSGGRSRF
jgi:hypothetical protein